MADIFDLKSTKGKFFFTILIVVLLVGLFIGVYLVPSRGKISKLESSLKDLELERREANRKATELATFRKYADVLKKEKETVESLVPAEDQETKIVEFMHYLAKLHGLHVEALTLAEPAPIPLAKKSKEKKTAEEKKLDETLLRAVRMLDAKMRVTGPFPNILDFLDDIKRSNRFYEVYKVSIPEDMPLIGDVTGLAIVLEGRFYYYAGELAPAPPSGTAFEQMVEREGLGEEYLEKEPEKETTAGAGESSSEEQSEPAAGDSGGDSAKPAEGETEKKPADDGKDSSGEGKIDSGETSGGSASSGKGGKVTETAYSRNEQVRRGCEFPAEYWLLADSRREVI
ncbi:MAG: hypothetical protein HRF49_09675 [bacterium]|jgi:hypothetical protein